MVIFHIRQFKIFKIHFQDPKFQVKFNQISTEKYQISFYYKRYHDTIQ